MRVLVTGAGGYIGRHLVPRLRDEGHEVDELHHDKLMEWVGCDGHGRYYTNLAICSGDTMSGDIDPEPDTVIHLAGRVDINLLPNPKGAHLPPVPGPCDIGELYRDNVLATANVLQYCLKSGVKHLIFASTQAVYGMEKEECQECGDPAQMPLDYYAASKLAAEKVLEMGRLQGLSISVLRLPGVYGGDRKGGTVYTMCRDALTRHKIAVACPYPIPMNVLHIEDVVEAFVAVAKWQAPNANWAEGGTWDISGPESCSLDILADEIASLVPRCLAWHEVKWHPEMQFWDTIAHHMLNWHPKPRKERLAQVLEEIKRGL